MFFNKGIQMSVDVTMYSAQVPCPPSGARQATRLPTSHRPIHPPPEATTVPLPSNPGTTGNGLVIPYCPFRNIRSAGPIGDAAILIRTCFELKGGSERFATASDCDASP